MSFLINEFITEKNLKGMFLVETWLNELTGVPVLIEACPPSYKFYQSVRLNKKGGGIAAFYLHH